jgi:hypothetical protein
VTTSDSPLKTSANTAVSDELARIAKQLDEVKRGRLKIDFTMSDITGEVSHAIDEAKQWRIGAEGGYDWKARRGHLSGFLQGEW